MTPMELFRRDWVEIPMWDFPQGEETFMWIIEDDPERRTLACVRVGDQYYVTVSDSEGQIYQVWKVL